MLVKKSVVEKCETKFGVEIEVALLEGWNEVPRHKYSPALVIRTRRSCGRR